MSSADADAGDALSVALFAATAVLVAAVVTALYRLLRGWGMGGA